MAREIFDEMSDMKRLFVHVYTGNGKGKTTADLRLSVRAAILDKRFFCVVYKGDGV